MTTTYLEYEVALLLAKYGKSAVLGCLSRKLQLAPSELEASLQEVPSKRASSGARAKHDALDHLEVLVQKYPRKGPFLRTLRDRFQDRTFLPELRDVRRFFEQNRGSWGSTKSRADSLGRLLNLLAELETSKLASLCEAKPEGTYSSLELIADEILRKHG